MRKISGSRPSEPLGALGGCSGVNVALLAVSLTGATATVVGRVLAELFRSEPPHRLCEELVLPQGIIELRGNAKQALRRGWPGEDGRFDVKPRTERDLQGVAVRRGTRGGAAGCIGHR